MTRKSLHVAAILGMSFTFDELLEVSLQMNGISSAIKEREAYAFLLRESMKAAAQEGILNETIVEVKEEDEVYKAMYNVMVDTDGSTGSIDDHIENVAYSFHHDTWRRINVSLLLDSYVQDIHRHAAIAIEARIPDNDMRDYRTKVKLFSHWKGSDDTIDAGNVALDLGMNFKLLGMNSQSADVYADTINMWKRHEPPEDEERIAGFSPLVLESLDEENLVTLIKLQIAYGQALGSTYTSSLDSQRAGAQVFKDSLEVGWKMYFRTLWKQQL